MGYLLFMDALGIQNYYNKGVEFANPIMNRIIRTAKNVFGKTLPLIGTSIEKNSANKLCIMNDTIFMYSNQLTDLIFFSVRFLKSMFMPKTNVDPIVFRGAIAVTEKPPKIIYQNSKNINISKLVIDNISSAMFVEKQKILGSRILIPKEVIDISDFKKWDMRHAVYIMDLEKIKNISDVDMLKNYYDLAWMIGKDKIQDKKIHESVVRFWEHAVFNERTALHASATMALYHVSQEKRKRLINYFNKIYVNQKAEGVMNNLKPNEFKEWCKFANHLRKVNHGIGVLHHP